MIERKKHETDEEFNARVNRLLRDVRLARKLTRAKDLLQSHQEEGINPNLLDLQRQRDMIWATCVIAITVEDTYKAAYKAIVENYPIPEGGLSGKFLKKNDVDKIFNDTYEELKELGLKELKSEYK